MRRVLHPVATWRWVAGWLLLGLLLGSGAALAQTVPGLPTITKVTPGSGSLHITWDAPSDTGGSAITTYDLYYISNRYRYEGTVTVDAGVLEYTLSGLLDDWQYGVQVRAHNERYGRRGVVRRHADKNRRPRQRPGHRGVPAAG